MAAPLVSCEAESHLPCGSRKRRESVSHARQSSVEAGGGATRTLTRPGSFLFLNINLHMVWDDLWSVPRPQEASSKRPRKGTCRLLCNVYFQPKEVMVSPSLTSELNPQKAACLTPVHSCTAAPGVTGGAGPIPGGFRAPRSHRTFIQLQGSRGFSPGNTPRAPNSHSRPGHPQGSGPGPSARRRASHPTTGLCPVCCVA